MNNREYRPGVRGFTLIELLAVVSIILLLFSLLLPSLAGIRGKAMTVRCLTVVRNFGQAAILYAQDTDGRLPSSIYAACCNGQAPYDVAWIGSEVLEASPGLASTGFFPRPGALQRYLSASVGRGRSYFRCPILPEAPLRSGAGSNGGFDYTMFCYTSGARIGALPRMATVIMPDKDGNATSATKTIPAPIYAEESPMYGNNNNFIDPDHVSVNRDGTWHFGGACVYFCVDGSAQIITYDTPIGPQAWFWSAKNASGVSYNLGSLEGWDIWGRNQ